MTINSLKSNNPTPTLPFPKGEGEELISHKGAFGFFMLAPRFIGVEKAHKPQILNGFKRFESAFANIPPVSPLSQRGENPKNHKSVINHDFYFRPIHRKTCWERSLSPDSVGEVPSLRPPFSIHHCPSVHQIPIVFSLPFGKGEGRGGDILPSIPPFPHPPFLHSPSSILPLSIKSQSSSPSPLGKGRAGVGLFIPCLVAPPSKNLKGWLMVSQNLPQTISKGGSCFHRTPLKQSKWVGHAFTEPPSNNLKRWFMVSQSPPQRIPKAGSWYRRAPLQESQKVGHGFTEPPSKHLKGWVTVSQRLPQRIPKAGSRRIRNTLAMQKGVKYKIFIKHYESMKDENE
jgi:hypothetical protein